MEESGDKVEGRVDSQPVERVDPESTTHNEEVDKGNNGLHPGSDRFGGQREEEPLINEDHNEVVKRTAIVKEEGVQSSGVRDQMDQLEAGRDHQYPEEEREKVVSAELLKGEEQTVDKEGKEERYRDDGHQMEKEQEEVRYRDTERNEQEMEESTSPEEETLQQSDTSGEESTCDDESVRYLPEDEEPEYGESMGMRVIYGVPFGSK